MNPYIYIGIDNTSLEYIAKVVCRICEISISELKKQTRGTQDHSDARHIFNKIASETKPRVKISDLSVYYTRESIGRFIGRKHSSVTQSIQKFEILYETDKRFRKKYDKIKKELKSTI